MAKKKKPNVTVCVDCPQCKAGLKVKVFKERIGKPEPAEYKVTTDVTVEKQGNLFKTDKKAAAEAKVA